MHLLSAKFNSLLGWFEQWPRPKSLVSGLRKSRLLIWPSPRPDKRQIGPLRMARCPNGLPNAEWTMFDFPLEGEGGGSELKKVGGGGGGLVKIRSRPGRKSLKYHWKKKWSHFDLKSWVTGGSKFRPWILSNWIIFESKWLDIESLIDNLTLNIESIWLKYYPITQNLGLNFISACDSTF